MFMAKRIILFISCLVLAFIEVNAALNGDKTKDAKCLLPMEPGPCRMRLNRFYYNAKTDSCEEFTFGGCKGNDNKFGFKQTCEAACKKQITTATKTPVRSAALPTTTSKTLAAATTAKTITPAPKRVTIAATEAKSKVQ